MQERRNGACKNPFGEIVQSEERQLRYRGVRTNSISRSLFQGMFGHERLRPIIGSNLDRDAAGMAFARSHVGVRERCARGSRVGASSIRAYDLKVAPTPKSVHTVHAVPGRNPHARIPRSAALQRYPHLGVTQVHAAQRRTQGLEDQASQKKAFVHMP